MALTLSPEQLEKFRTIGLRLDRTGTFWHDGAAVTHARLREALLGWLDVRDDGRDIVRLDATRYAYVDVEDAHVRARSARWDGDRCLVLWDDGHERELEYDGLHQAADHALYTAVTRRGPTGVSRLRGRIAGPAYHAVVERISEIPGGFVLVAAGARWPIADAA